ncbi:MAG TPA: hypothetical protein VE619_10515 [Nitrososphaeraceae archaeon]|nr:hypothetical protein [Nitrososphaeraceae archaeon]
MAKITEKVKEKLKGAKDKAASTTKEGASTTKEKMSGAKDKVASTTKETVGRASSSTSGTRGQTSKFEEGGPGTEIGREDDPLTEYREKEPMTPAKIKEHEPTAVKREMSEKITEGGQTGTSSQDAAEKARKSGMTKGTAGAAETGSEYEQGSAGANK